MYNVVPVVNIQLLEDGPRCCCPYRSIHGYQLLGLELQS
jgi:hypothetical protein